MGRRKGEENECVCAEDRGAERDTAAETHAWTHRRSERGGKKGVGKYDEMHIMARSVCEYE